MKFFILVGILAVMSGFYRDAMGKKPRMLNPVEDEINLIVGDELRIECYSEEAKLQFVFPATTAMAYRSFHEILPPTGNGTYTFLRRRTVLGDTGWYACAEESMKIDDEFGNQNHMHENISWIYVYVDGFLPEFADVSFNLVPKTIIGVVGSTVIVPCRLSSPQTDVKLVYNYDYITKSDRVEFDPKIGFSMKEVSSQDDGASLDCKYSGSWDNYILKCSGPKPRMITANDKDLIIQEGDELKIECYSEHKVSFMFPSDTFPDLPAQSEYRIVAHQNGTNTFIRRKAISNDTGWYGCAGEGVKNDIPYYSINYTRKGIDWVYIYVNCDVRKVVTESLKPTIVDADDRLAHKDIIIRMVGEDLRMIFGAFVPDSKFLQLEWNVPSTVKKTRVHYNETWTDSVEGNIYLPGKSCMMTITDVTVIDSGEYSCTAKYIYPYEEERDFRYVEIFDRDEERYVKLTRKGAAIEITGRVGGTVKWLVNLEHFASANVSWAVRTLYQPEGKAVNTAGYKYQIRVASRGGAQYRLFIIDELTIYDAGHYVVYVDSGNETTFINVTIYVEEPVTARIRKPDRSPDHYFKPRQYREVNCATTGWPVQNVTLSFLNCPKFPSREDSTSLVLDEFIPGSVTTAAIHPFRTHSNKPLHIPRKLTARFNIEMSGFLICEVCNLSFCSRDTKELYFSVSDEPYFTSTNLNQARVTFNRGSDTTLVLECYVGGRPRPKVTWLEDNKTIERVDLQLKFAYNNSELTISVLHFGAGGNRRYTCRAGNEFGQVEDYIDVTIQDGTGKSQQTEVLSSSLIAIVVTLLVVVVICCTVIYKLIIKASKKKAVDLEFKNGASSRLDPELPIVDQAEKLPYDLKWEYPRGLLKFDNNVLGSGAFGIVKKAEARSICRGEAVTTVAVKLVRSHASLNFITALSRELKILAYLGKHPNVVNLLGACTKNVFYGELFVIVEYCRFGNLRDYMLTNRADFVGQIHVVTENIGGLSASVDRVDVQDGGFESNVEGDVGVSETGDRAGQSTDITGSSEASDDCGRDENSGNGLRSKYRGDYTDLNLESICTRDLVYWSWQVARAMEFLGERKIVHGDLAARNILLADNGIVKVCDFGLAKALYKEAEYRDPGGNPLPVKWMAIESIKDQVFSYQSDIWSYGILMWELFTLGETPYPGIRNRALYQKLADGYRMGHPKYAEISIYEMMQRCWEADPAKRPAFIDLAHNLCDLLDDGFKAYYLEMHAEYMQMNAELMENGKDYLTMSLDATSASGMHEEIEMNTFTRDESRNRV